MTTPIVLDGRAYAAEINEDLKRRTESIIEKTGRTPILATVLVGDNPASITYVKMKGSACRRAGIESKKVVLPSTSTTDDVIKEINLLNGDENIHGILLQHPVPETIDEQTCFNAIAPEKDVDGVNYNSFLNLMLCTNSRLPSLKHGVSPQRCVISFSVFGELSNPMAGICLVGRMIGTLLKERNNAGVGCLGRRELPLTTPVNSRSMITM